MKHLVLTIQEAMKYCPEFFGGDDLDNWWVKEIWDGITTRYYYPWMQIKTDHVIAVWNQDNEMVGFTGYIKD